MKNKLSLLNLLLGIMLLLASCEMQTKDEIAEPTMNFSSELNQEAFSKVIPYKFKVDWNNPVKGYSQELQTEFYEYNIVWLDNFNPDVLEQKRSHLNIHTTYKLIAVLDKDKVEFYNVKIIEKNTNKTPGLSFTALNKFTGRIYFLNEQNDKIQVSSYLEGKFKGNITERTEEEQLLFLQTTRMGEDCYTVETAHYTDYYNASTGQFLYSTYNYTTYSTVCDGTGSYGGYSGGGTGGSTSGGSSGGSYDDCGDPVHGCLYEIKDVLVPEEEAWEDTHVDETDLNSNPCANTVYKKLNQAYTMYNMLQNFEGEKPVLHLDWDIEDLGANGLTRYTPGNFYVEVIIDRTYLGTASSISVARTMLHEVIHAEMMRKMTMVGWNPSNNDFPGLLDYYTRYKYDLDGTPQHNLMASHYRDLIITGLKEFDKLNGTAYRDDTFYEALSWAGLDNTRAWSSLSDTQKANYLKVIQDQAKAGGCN